MRILIDGEVEREGEITMDEIMIRLVGEKGEDGVITIIDNKIVVEKRKTN